MSPAVLNTLIEAELQRAVVDRLTGQVTIHFRDGQMMLIQTASMKTIKLEGPGNGAPAQSGKPRPMRPDRERRGG